MLRGTSTVSPRSGCRITDDHSWENDGLKVWKYLVLLNRSQELALKCACGEMWCFIVTCTKRVTAQSGRLLLHEATPGEMRLCTYMGADRNTHTHR